MGDRSNILVLQTEENKKTGIFIYSHWEGLELPLSLQKALKRRQRWTDEGYLTRIIVCEVINPDFNGETGYGITTYLTDNEYPILVVDVEGQTIGVSKPEEPFKVLYSVSFETFCSLTEDQLGTFRTEKI